jgi:hypothetical protein
MPALDRLLAASASAVLVSSTASDVATHQRDSEWRMSRRRPRALANESMRWHRQHRLKTANQVTKPRRQPTRTRTATSAACIACTKWVAGGTAAGLRNTCAIRAASAAANAAEAAATAVGAVAAGSAEGQYIAREKYDFGAW